MLYALTVVLLLAAGPQQMPSLAFKTEAECNAALKQVPALVEHINTTAKQKILSYGAVCFPVDQKAKPGLGV